MSPAGGGKSSAVAVGKVSAAGGGKSSATAVGKASAAAAGKASTSTAVHEGKARMATATAAAVGTAPVARQRITAVGPLPRQPPVPLELRGRKVQVGEMSSSGSEEENDEEDETEVTDMDSDTNAVMEEKTTHRKRVTHAPTPRGPPQCGSQRTTPCSRCVRLGRDCYEQVNRIHACYTCGKAKVRCVTGGVGEVARSRRGRVPAATKAKKASASREKKTSSARRFTRAEKGKFKGESYPFIIP